MLILGDSWGLTYSSWLEAQVTLARHDMTIVMIHWLNDDAKYEVVTSTLYV